MLRYNLFVHRSYLINTFIRRTLFGRDSSTKKIKDDFDEEIIEQPDSVPQSAVPTISDRQHQGPVGLRQPQPPDHQYID